MVSPIPYSVLQAHPDGCCAGTGVAYPPFPAYTGPAILDSSQAAELDAQFFFSGTPWEMVGRNYTAQTLNLANGGNLTQYDVKSELHQCLHDQSHTDHEGCAACPRR